MIEKAAKDSYEAGMRCLIRHHYKKAETVKAWDDLNPMVKAVCMDEVRAVLASIRDNPDALLPAFDKVGIDQDPREYWTAGIDAILEGK